MGDGCFKFLVILLLGFLCCNACGFCGCSAKAEVSQPTSFKQQEVEPFKGKHGWGLQNEQKKIVLKPIYRDVDGDGKFFGVYNAKGRCGVVDARGVFVHEMKYSDCFIFGGYLILYEGSECPPKFFDERDPKVEAPPRPELLDWMC